MHGKQAGTIHTHTCIGTIYIPNTELSSGTGARSVHGWEDSMRIA